MLGTASTEIVNNLSPHIADLSDFIVKMYAAPTQLSDLMEVTPILKKILTCLTDHECLTPTYKSIYDFTEAFPELVDGNCLVDVKSFKSFWGRAQQYISLTAA